MNDSSEKNKKGFALPTLLIVSVIMLTVLVSAVSATSSLRSALDTQYYSQLAREMAESGVARANECLKNSGYIAEWDEENNLFTNTTCDGTYDPNMDRYVIDFGGNTRGYFVVHEPEKSGSSQLVKSTGYVELYTYTWGDTYVWRTFDYSYSARVGAKVDFSTVVFGYSGGDGSYFATLSADNKIQTVGYNGFGQLGDGTYDDHLTPKEYTLPESERGTAVFTNFLSGGRDMFVLSNTGNIYGSGINNYGQLGDGTTTNRPSPVEYGLPSGQIGKVVSFGAYSSYVITESGNIYASGLCSDGLLGTNYTISGCSNRTNPARVALPTVTSDLNTIPTTNITTDYHTVLVRMQGGRVYGWGYNTYGQLGSGTSSRSSPVQISTYGDSGQPKAVQAAVDGDTTYILDDTGVVKSVGANMHGQLGGEDILIVNNGASNKCIDNSYANGVDLALYNCQDSANQRFTFMSDGTIYNSNSNKCIDNYANDGSTLKLWSCHGGPNQVFTWRDDGSIYNANSNKCFSNIGNDGSTFGLASCTTSSYRKFNLKNITNRMVKFNLPSSAGTAKKIATDQWYTAVLTTNGEVWSAGSNRIGQLGNGRVRYYEPCPVKFILPSGVTAMDVYVSSYSTTTSPYRYNNIFVIGSNGRVYGAGANQFGQLGDGTTTSRSTPVAMNTIDGVDIVAKQVVSGYGTTVVLTQDGVIYTVGNNENGQLGDGTTTNSSTPRANRYTNILPVTSF